MTFSRAVALVVGAVALRGRMGWAQSASVTVASSEQPGQYTIHTTSRLVLLDVSVKDSSGGFVSGLKKDDFKVYENGKPETVTQFADADVPVTVGIVVDESGSMRPKRSE